MHATFIRIRPRTPADDAEWRRMRELLWPNDAPGGQEARMAEALARPGSLVLVAERTDGQRLAGFAEVALRPFAVGCTTSPIAYLEGWYVDPDVQRQGIGAALVGAAEEWARAQGVREFVSDASIENLHSHRAHRFLGFTEQARFVRYRKAL